MSYKDEINIKLRALDKKICCLRADIAAGVNFPRVLNYSALPPAADHTDEFYVAENSQGTYWLPGTIGGTFRSKGFYYSDGVDWIFAGDIPYQATQPTVDAGIVNDQFVTPLTLKNSSQWGTKANVSHTHTSSDITNFQSSVSANSDVNLNTLARHTHTNLSLLETITEAFTGTLKTAYDSTVSWITTNGTNLLNHLSNTSNPHSVTKAQVGLGNVDDVSAANLRDRSTHTGTQTSSTISDINETVEDIIGTKVVAGTNISISYNDTTGETTVTGTGGGAVDSVNSQTGVVVLDADDISDAGTTNKYTTAADISKLAGIEALAEVNNISDVNATDLTDGGDTTLHTHDGRYYTEGETDTLLSGKANSSHTHVKADITDFVHTHVISDTTGLQTALDGKVDENTAITGATKTKITYDSKGLITSGADATTADISDTTNKRYVTDAQLTVIGNTSGTNTGDQTITLTGNVTGSGTGSFATTIANDAVTYAKIQNVSAASKLLGRGDSGSGDVEEITIGSGLTMTGTTLSASGGGGGSPGGSTTQVQYNNAGAFGGASNILVKDNSLVLNNEASPTAASANTAKLTATKVGNGISMPSFLSENGLKTLQPFIGQNRISYLQPLGMSSTIVTTVGMTATAVGTAVAANFANGSIKDTIRRIEYRGTFAAASIGGFTTTPNGIVWFGNVANAGGFLYVHRWGIGQGPVNSSAYRAFTGFRNVTSAPTDVEPSSLINMFGVGCDGLDTQLQFMHNDGSGTATKIPLGANFLKPTTDREAYYELIMYSAPNTSTVQYSIRNLDTGNSTTGSVSTNLPSNILQFQPFGYVSSGGVANQMSYSFAYMYIQENN